MPAKSKHGRGKHPHRSRKSKSIQRQSAAAVTQSAAAVKQSVAPGRPVPEATTEKPSPAKAVIESGKTQVVKNPYIANELRRIGILAGIILVVLIILAIILS